MLNVPHVLVLLRRGRAGTLRDGEWLVGGVIPKDYIIHQGHTLPGAVGAGAASGADRDDR